MPPDKKMAESLAPQHTALDRSSEPLSLPTCPWLAENGEEGPSPRSLLSEVGEILRRHMGPLQHQEVPGEIVRKSLEELSRFLSFKTLAIRRYLLNAFLLRPEEASDALMARLESDSRPEMIQGALLCLGVLSRKLSPEEGVRIAELAVSHLRSRDKETLEAARRCCVYLGNAVAKEGLQSALSTFVEDPQLAAQFSAALGDTRDAGQLERIIKTLSRAGWWRGHSRIKLPPQLLQITSSLWLSQRLQDDDVVRFATGLGFIDAETGGRLSQGRETELVAAAEVLASIELLSSQLFDAYLATPVQQRKALLKEWQQRCVSFVTGSGEPEERPLQPVRLHDPSADGLDADFALAALRAVDFDLATEPDDPEPFSQKTEGQVKFSRIFYKSPAEFRAWLCESSGQLEKSFFPAAADSSLAQLVQPYVLGDYLAVLSECDRDESIEAKLKFYSRWHAFSRMTEVSGNELRLKPEYDAISRKECPLCIPDSCEVRDLRAVRDFLTGFASSRASSLWRFAVIDAATETKAEQLLAAVQEGKSWSGLSPGAQSVLRVVAHDIARSVDGPLPEPEMVRAVERAAELEGAADGVLSPQGIEIQTPNVDQEYAFAWKVMLERWGIPSPRRIQFAHTVEAAFRPVRAGELYLQAIPILHRIGLHEKYSGASALHISIEGNLGKEAAFIAIPLRYFRLKDPKRDTANTSRQNTMVMSKGLVYLNERCENVRPGEAAPPVRTETRLAALQNKGESGELVPFYRRIIPAVQLLATAALAYRKPLDEGPLSPLEEELAKLWFEYRERVSEVCREERYGASALLDIDWYESTGEGRDPDLVFKLKNLEILQKVSEHLGKTRPLYVEFQDRLRGLFLEYAEKISLATSDGAP